MKFTVALFGVILGFYGVIAVDHLAPPAHSLSAQRDSIVAQQARKWGVPPALAVHVSHVEDWSGDSMATSPAGAVGIMQVQPRFWAHAFDADCGTASLFNMTKNACVGVHVMTAFYMQTNEWASALRLYNGKAGAYRYTDQLLDVYIQEESTK
jgi:soluble lytic murein transglycosylase-like protein